MHDYFQILGVSDAAPPHELRRALRRRPGRSHPDFHDGAAPIAAAQALDDVAIDFVDMHPIVDRMLVGFFK